MDIAEPAIFLHGQEQLSARELRALSPDDAVLRHRGGELAQSIIMMVDDEPLNIELTQAFLAEAGYRRFVHTDDPVQAVPLMRRQVPAVLLLDLSMPRLSGMDILAVMRDDPVLRHVPVIVLTSSTDPQVKLKALALGAMDFLSKPVDPTELALRIRNTLAATAYRDYLTHHDQLTGLPNRLRYRKMANDVLAQARASGTSGAFLHVGVDGLGRINDALGRAVGDQLLQRVAKRLASCVQTEAHGELSSEQHNPTLFRFDGDEFAIIVPQMDSVASAASFINKLLEDSTISFNRSGGQELLLTCSIGVSVFPDDGLDPDILMSNAGLALRQSKAKGKHGYEFFSRSFNEQALNRLDLGADLRRAFGRDEIELVYEPRIEVASGLLVACQALVRWRHASGRLVEGDELMELAGHAEMEVALLDWVLDQVLQHSSNWRKAGLVPVPVAIKGSLAHLQPAHLRHAVYRVLAAGIEPRMLALELQQAGSVLANLGGEELGALQALRVQGVRLVLDRFGEQAAVAQLRRLKVDAIKVDPSFMPELAQRPDLQAMVLGIGDLARRLGIQCVACGVDTPQQLAFLASHRWDQAQGRIYGEPLSGIAFAVRWLTRKGMPPRRAGDPGIPGAASGGPRS